MGHWSEEEGLSGIASELGSGRRLEACLAGLRLNYELVEVEGVVGDARGGWGWLYL